MSVNKLAFGGADYDEEIVAGGGGLSMDHAMVGETLAVDALTVPLITGDVPERLIASDMAENDMIRTADGVIICVKKGAPTPEFVKNGSGLYYFGDDLIGKYYLNEMNRTGQHERIMRFLSAIRLLDQSDHHGGLYMGETAGVVISDIIGDVVTHTIDEDIAAIQIYGYLPYARRRANLQLVLMAITAAVKNAVDGSLRVTQLSGTSAGIFAEPRVFIGGEVIDRIPATAVQVVEHNYLPSNEGITLFDDSTLGTETVKFREPYHDLQITGGTIVASGVNFCTFSASGAVVLTGKKYTHVTRVITIGTAPTGSESDVVKSVSNNTLLTPNNAVIVAEKLFEYLSVAQSIKQEVVFGTERPGDVVSVMNPYTSQMVSACIKSMDISFGSSELRAVCEFLAGYVPAGATAGFQNYEVLTGSGTFTIPAGVTRIRVILIGGGAGGTGGLNGVNATTGSSGAGGAGGSGGPAGQGALIFEMNINVNPGDSYSFDCGNGGTGGAVGVEGASGESTTFGALSSAVGRLYPYGYSEPKSGLILAANGDEGVSGGRGNNYSEPISETVTFNGTTYNAGSTGDTVTFNQSGTTANAIGGGGGGPAVGNNGSDGGDGVSQYMSVAGGPYGIYTGYWAVHGARGAGANAIDGVDAATYGGGGGGGHGGGGGGFVVGDLPYQFDIPGANYGGDGGVCGLGSAGGDGGPGAIVVYS